MTCWWIRLSQLETKSFSSNKTWITDYISKISSALIWLHKSWSTFVEVTACFLIATNRISLNADLMSWWLQEWPHMSKSKSKSKYVYFSRYIIYAHNLEHRGQNKISALVYHISYDVPHVTLAETHCFPIEFEIYDTWRQGPNGRYLADNIFKWIFLNE